MSEETGLGLADAVPEPGWSATPLGQRIALMKIVQARENATALRERILAFLANQERPELADIHIVRSVADLRAEMPPYVAAYLRHRLR